MGWIARAWSYDVAQCEVPNEGGRCRDFCAAERNALSHLRTSLTLALLGLTFLTNVNLRLNEPTRPADPSSPTHHRRRTFVGSHDVSHLLGIVFAGVAIIVLVSGVKIHWQSTRALREGGHKVGPSAIDTFVLGFVALLIFTAIILLIVAH